MSRKEVLMFILVNDNGSYGILDSRDGVLEHYTQQAVEALHLKAQLGELSIDIDGIDPDSEYLYPHTLEEANAIASDQPIFFLCNPGGHDANHISYARDIWAWDIKHKKLVFMLQTAGREGAQLKEQLDGLYLNEKIYGYTPNPDGIFYRFNPLEIGWYVSRPKNATYVGMGYDDGLAGQLRGALTFRDALRLIRMTDKAIMYNGRQLERVSVIQRLEHKHRTTIAVVETQTAIEVQA